MLLFSQKHAFYFSILRIKEGLSHVQQPHFYDIVYKKQEFTKKKDGDIIFLTGSLSIVVKVKIAL